MRAGFGKASGEWVVNFDIDYFSGPFLRDGLALADSADIVLASKRAEGADDRRSLLRRAGTFAFNMILKLLFRIASYQAGQVHHFMFATAFIPFCLKTIQE